MFHQNVCMDGFTFGKLIFDVQRKVEKEQDTILTQGVFLYFYTQIYETCIMFILVTLTVN